jgi:uncharacterized protein YkwD
LNTRIPQLGIEYLEARDCPAVTANLFNGVLTVLGDDANNVITISRSGPNFVAAGRAFPATAVARIVISAGGGDDTVTNATGKPAVIYGGTGNDILRGGAGNDIIYGGHGNDTIYGGAGDDRLYGGSGTNTITDTVGRNQIYHTRTTMTAIATALEAQIIQFINARRAAHGIAPLRVSGQLNAAADLHSKAMAEISNQYGPNSGHQHVLVGSTRPHPSDRLDAVGYDNWSTAFTWGENIAYGYTSAASVVDGWMNSPGHRANILNASFTETGVGVAVDSAGRLFFTQMFGHRG